MAVNVWNLQVGDKVREEGSDYDVIVHRIEPPTSSGRAERHGPRIFAHIASSSYSVSFDAETAHRFEKVY